MKKIITTTIFAVVVVLGANRLAPFVGKINLKTSIGDLLYVGFWIIVSIISLSMMGTTLIRMFENKFNKSLLIVVTVAVMSSIFAALLRLWM